MKTYLRFFLWIVIAVAATFNVRAQLVATTWKQAHAGAVEMTPQSLMCEDMTDLAVLETRHPRLSWINVPVSDTLKGKRQTAWQIRAASSKEKLLKGRADLLNTGKNPDDGSFLFPIRYSGKTLRGGQDAWWQVRVWDERGIVSDWSEPAHFGVGLNAEDWKARWIGAPWQTEEVSAADSIAPMFRKDFILKGKVERVKAYITAMGFFELYANGTRVGDDYYVPNFTNFTRREGLDKANIPISDHFRDYRIMYLAYDLTPYVHEGGNAVGVLLGNGWAHPSHRLMQPFGSPRFICQLEITYKGGRHETVVTDDSWLVKPSPIQMNDIYKGEVYDARLEEPLWASAGGGDTSGWQTAVVRKAPDGKLTAHDAPTDKVVETLKPLSLVRNKEGVWTATFDHVISGRIHLKGIRGKEGQMLTIHYPCEEPVGSDLYIYKGIGEEEYGARFAWYVFSEAVITGVDSLTPEMVTAECIGTDVPLNARFTSSDSLLNRINTIWQQSQIDNMHCGVASDCPHRERAPYTGDGQVACPTVMENFQATAFYRKWLRDMRDTQNVDDGYVPNGAPWQPICGGGVAWGAAMNIIPWELYMHTGDLFDLSENYNAMKDQLHHMQQSITADGTMFQQKGGPDGKPLYWLNLGDWSPAFGLPSDELVHTFYLWYCAELMVRAASVESYNLCLVPNVYTEDFETYHALAERTRAAFHRKFYNPETKSYGDYGSNVLALYMGVPDSVKADVVRTLDHELADTYKGHLNTGIFGTRFLFEVLCDNGLTELALRILRQRDFPGFGYWIEQGATVTWEAWNGDNSRNHPMFGGGLVSLYRDLVGVRLEPPMSTPKEEWSRLGFSLLKSAGYRHVIIRPCLSPSLPYVAYEKQTPFGLLRSEVRREEGGFRLTVTIPVGTTATVILPGREPETLAQGTYIIRTNG